MLNCKEISKNFKNKKILKTKNFKNNKILKTIFFQGAAVRSSTRITWTGCTSSWCGRRMRNRSTRCFTKWARSSSGAAGVGNCRFRGFRRRCTTSRSTVALTTRLRRPLPTLLPTDQVQIEVNAIFRQILNFPEFAARCFSGSIRTRQVNPIFILN